MKTSETKKAYYPAPKDMPPAAQPDWVVDVVTDVETNDVEAVKAVRNRACRLTRQYGITPALWGPFLTMAYHDFEGCFKNNKGKEVVLNTDLFELDDATLFEKTAKQVTRAHAQMRERFETLCCIPCEHPRFRTPESREFFKVVACILRTLTDQDALFIALKIKVSNDNKPQE
jgi:hypothetical protein